MRAMKGHQTRRPRLNVMVPLAEPDELPVEYDAKIGQIILRCSEIEYRLLVITKRILGVGVAEARLLFSSGRWSDRLDRLNSISRIRSFEHGMNIKLLRKEFENLEWKRNMLVHEAIRKDGNRFIGIRAGAQARKLNSHSPAVTRAEHPEEVTVDDDFLDDMLVKLDTCLLQLRDASKRSSELLSSSE